MQKSDFLHDLGQTLRYSHEFANITQHKTAFIYGGCAPTMAHAKIYPDGKVDTSPGSEDWEKFQVEDYFNL